jgi:uncharacterized membrane protein
VRASWGVLLFAGLILIWAAINTVVLILRPFDPYLLNLLLSCLAALQAPIIMMSQNRQEARDRLRSEYDYRVNLKAELEIRQLLDVVADRGYFNSEEILACDEAGITVTLPQVAAEMALHVPGLRPHARYEHVLRSTVR